MTNIASRQTRFQTNLYYLGGSLKAYVANNFLLLLQVSVGIQRHALCGVEACLEYGSRKRFFTNRD
jgi:hypothetical protein